MIIAKTTEGKLVAASPEQVASYGWTPVEKVSQTATGLTPAGTSFSITQDVFVEKKEEKPSTSVQQLEAKEIKRVQEAGGGYMATGSGVMKIAGKEGTQGKEVIKVPTKADPNVVIQIPISAGVSQKVAAAGGWEYVVQQSNQMNQQREMEYYVRDYVVPSIVRQYEYEATAAAEFAASIIKTTLTTGAISSVLSSTQFVANPLLRTGMKLPFLFGTSYQFFSRAASPEGVSFPEAFLYLTSIGLTSASIYNDINQYYQSKLVDPVLKDIDIKKYHEQPVKKYVAKYGEQSMIRETTSGELKLREQYQQDILGKPTDRMLPIKNYDKAIKITFQHHDISGLEKTKVITFKLTDEGWKPMGKIDLDRYFPSQHKLFKILDDFNRGKIDITKGYVEKYTITPANKIQTILKESYILPKESIYTIKYEWVGVEKPEIFQPLIKEAVIKPSGINWDVYRSLDLETTKKIDPILSFGTKEQIANIAKEMGIKNLINVPEGRIDIDIKTGEIQSHAVNLAMQPQPELVDMLKTETPIPIAYIGITTTPQHIFIDIPQATGIFNIPLVSPLILNIPNQIKKNELITMQLLGEKATPIDVQKLTAGTSSGQPELYVPVSAQIISPAQEQINLQQLDQIEMLMTPPPEPYITIDRIPPERPERVDYPSFDIPFPARKMEEEEEKMRRGDFKIVRGKGFILPTASMASLERAAAKFGSASLARGKGIEKRFAGIVESEGLSAEFPAAEFLKIRKKPTKRRRKRWMM